MLTTLATLKQSLRVETTDTAPDVWLSRQIDVVSAQVETYCRRIFAYAATTDTIELERRDSALLLSRYPVDTAEDVTVSYGDDYELDVDTEYYRLSPTDGIIRPRGSWPSRWMQIAYTGGYVLPGNIGRTLPHDLEQGVIDLIERRWYRWKETRDPMIRSITVPDVMATSYVDGLRQDEGMDVIPSSIEAYRDMRL